MRTLFGMTRRVAIVPHTHWDREWYDGFQSFRFRLVEMLSALLDRLESDPGHRYFLLDGQMAVIDDYLEIRPEDEDRLRRLVRAGRLSVGPWYTLMDEFLVSGETIIRNLQLGVARASSFGGHLPVGYLPDMFGHVAQMPQILRQAGLDHAVVWRGVPATVDRTAFWWRALDGSTVRAEYLPAGYSNGASVPEDPEAMLRRLDAHEAQLAPFLSPDAAILWMNGTDHQAPQAWLPGLVDQVNERQKDFELAIVGLADYLAGAPSEALPSWTGELRSGARANVLMGVASNRVDIKVAAARAERALEQRAEPLAALWLPAGRWPARLFDEAWLQLIRNSAHDSICACSADEVGLAVRHRYAEATSIANEIASVALRHAAGGQRHSGPVVVNPSPGDRCDLVELTVNGETPPPGTQVVEVTPMGTVEREGRGRDLARLLAELTEAGWLDDGRGTSAAVNRTADGVELAIVLDRAAATDVSLRPVDSVMAEAAAQAAADPAAPLSVRVERRPSLRLLAQAHVPGYGWAPLPALDAGSADPAAAEIGPAVRAGSNWLDNGLVHLAVNPADGTFSVNGLSGMDRLVDDGDAGDTYNYSPPDEDVVVTRPERVTVDLVESGPLRGRLLVRRSFVWPARVERGRRSGTEAVEVVTTLELRAGDPLVRIEAGWDDRACDHRLRAVFPLAERADHSDAECAFAVVRRGLEAEGGPGEVGLATFPSRRFVRAGGVTLTHEGLLEYEVIDDGWALALTLLRATGILSQPAPTYRPNAAGPPDRLADTEMSGPVRVRYGVVVGAVDPWRCTEAAWNPLEVVYGTGRGQQPRRGSHLQVSGAEVSSLRRVAGALEIRVFNPADAPAVVTVAGRSGWLVDLLGRPLEPWEGSFVLPPRGLATARLDQAAGDEAGG
jgi:mannosylglycerate hydrolase